MKKENGVRLQFKQVKDFKPVCPDCGEILFGDNSMMLPYTCTECCVMWKSSMEKPYLFSKEIIVLRDLRNVQDIIDKTSGTVDLGEKPNWEAIFDEIKSDR